MWVVNAPPCLSESVVGREREMSEVAFLLATPLKVKVRRQGVSIGLRWEKAADIERVLTAVLSRPQVPREGSSNRDRSRWGRA